MLGNFIKSFFVCIFCLASSVVHAQDKPSSTGTGFIINRDGWIVTNEHVVRQCDEITVNNHGRVIQKIMDQQNNIAAIRVQNTSSKDPLEFSISNSRLGQDVIAFGFPLAGLLSQSVKLTKGVINSLSGIGDDSRYLQISAAVQDGNSGGPLVNNKGSVIGVVTAKINEKALQELDVYTENVNFALNSSVVKQFLDANSIDYELAPASLEPMSTEEVAEKIAPSTLLISCFGQSEQQAQQAEESQVIQGPDTENELVGPDTWYFAAYGNIDFWGGDKYSKGLEAEDNITCAKFCAADIDCKAFTYNPRYNRCFIKERADIIVATEGLSSGIIFKPDNPKDTNPRAPFLVTDFMAHEGQEFTGISLPFFQPGQRISSIDQCLRYCYGDSQCSFVTFNRREQGRASCKIRRFSASNLKRNGNAHSFQRTQQRVMPAGDVIRLDIARYSFDQGSSYRP